MNLREIFKEAMERHKRLDSWIVAIFLTGAFYYFLWVNNLIASFLSFAAILILPFIFPKPKKKIKFIDEFIGWEIAWFTFPPYSKLIDWIIEGVGFILTIYGTWQHNFIFIIIGVLVVLVGLADFLVRFGYKRAFQKNE